MKLFPSQLRWRNRSRSGRRKPPRDLYHPVAPRVDGPDSSTDPGLALFRRGPLAGRNLRKHGRKPGIAQVDLYKWFSFNALRRNRPTPQHPVDGPILVLATAGGLRFRFQDTFDNHHPLYAGDVGTRHRIAPRRDHHRQLHASRGTAPCAEAGTPPSRR